MPLICSWRGACASSKSARLHDALEALCRLIAKCLAAVEGRRLVDWAFAAQSGPSGLGASTIGKLCSQSLVAVGVCCGALWRRHCQTPSGDRWCSGSRSGEHALQHLRLHSLPTTGPSREVRCARETVSCPRDICGSSVVVRVQASGGERQNLTEELFTAARSHAASRWQLSMREVSQPSMVGREGALCGCAAT